MPASIRSVIDSQLDARPHPSHDLTSALDYYRQMAEATFLHYGYHVFMLFLLGDDWRPVDMLSAEFADQTDKFIFWRSVADRIETRSIFGIVWIGESWLRKTQFDLSVAVRHLPIEGERLTVVGLDRQGSTVQHGWSIRRAEAPSKPTLETLGAEDLGTEQPFFLVPVRRAFGLPDPEYVPKRDAP